MFPKSYDFYKNYYFLILKKNILLIIKINNTFYIIVISINKYNLLKIMKKSYIYISNYIQIMEGKITRFIYLNKR